MRRAGRVARRPRSSRLPPGRRQPAARIHQRVQIAKLAGVPHQNLVAVDLAQCGPGQDVGDSAANVPACSATPIEPLIARGRQPHYPPLDARFAAAPEPPKNPTPVEAMAHRLQTAEGGKLYALGKQIPEPVFGIIKSVMGFRQFLLRGIDRVRGEWSLVTMAWNMKRMFVLRPV
jgi:hypothetical protein